MFDTKMINSFMTRLDNLTKQIEVLNERLKTQNDLQIKAFEMSEPMIREVYKQFETTQE